ncbi:hypothetical protein ACFQH2_02345 [Natronoarchaeum sp. GCM10025703]|uniref:hypothetical protein n=1 Tax=Natronoarchaeum sp. GCM10025703 TaxID=3252685 RepID=UPI00361BB556
MVGFRNRITKPLARRIPVSILRRAHRLRRRVRPDGYTDANPFAVVDVESVPVLIHRRHRRCQEVRDRVREQARDAVDEVHREHPDLGDIDRRDPT